MTTGIGPTSVAGDGSARRHTLPARPREHKAASEADGLCCGQYSQGRGEEADLDAVLSTGPVQQVTALANGYWFGSREYRMYPL